MSRLKIADNQSNFVLDGKPFFYLGDTVWSAFTNISMEEWEYYLERRKEQGFNVLQMNTLPQWDRCLSDTDLYPFALKDDQRFDFSKWNDVYYQNAREMCRKAVDKGFQLALVVLWVNYVPGTWGSKVYSANIIPQDILKEFVERVIYEFDEFEPIYVISGDTDFDSQESIDYYEKALRIISEESPESLKTFHIKRGYDVIPETFLDKIDFYMFQSGHNRDEQSEAFHLPERIRKKYPKKPVLNAEPCYEQMGYSRRRYGRFRTADIRRAAWSSLLSGACAGIAYGAHGIWNWQKLHKTVNPNLGEGFDAAVSWEKAIHFPGAWDYGMMRQIFQLLHLEELNPCNELLVNQTEEIRMAYSPTGKYLLYLPSSTRIVLNRELDFKEVTAVDLEKKRSAFLSSYKLNGTTVIHMHPFESDVLLVLVV